MKKDKAEQASSLIDDLRFQEEFNSKTNEVLRDFSYFIIQIDAKQRIIINLHKGKSVDINVYDNGYDCSRGFGETQEQSVLIRNRIARFVKFLRNINHVWQYNVLFLHQKENERVCK